MKTIIRNLALALCAALVLTGCGKAEKKALSDCHKNTKDIMIALMKYSNNHKGILPSDLQELTKEGLLTSEKLVCPGAEKGASCSYELLCPGATLEKLAPSTPVICCRAHKGKTVIGRADGSVYTMEGELKAETADTPKAVAGAWAKAALAGDYKTADSYVSTDLAKEAEKRKVSFSEAVTSKFKKLDGIPADAKLKPGEAAAIKEMQALKKAFEKFGEGNEKIDGDKATVTSGSITLHFVKEDGKWKISTIK